MYEKEKDLVRAFMAGKLSRRELMARTSALGASAAVTGTLLGAAATKALAADFDWMKHKGKSVKLLLNKHPYADAMIANLENFKALTGMDVSYDIFPEDVYFDKVTAALSSQVQPVRRLHDRRLPDLAVRSGRLDRRHERVSSAKPTRPSPTTTGTTFCRACALRPPGPAFRAPNSAGPDSKQWCIPWGFELNNVAYNRNIFDKLKLSPPQNMAEMMDVAAKITKDAGGPYGIGVRGSRSWATIHPGFLSGYTNFGGKDLKQEGGKLRAAMDSAESKAFTAQWVKMIQDSGPEGLGDLYLVSGRHRSGRRRLGDDLTTPTSSATS